MEYLYQRLCAPNDSNGNPRRVFAVYDATTGSIVSTTDEGYQGTPRVLRDYVQLPDVQVTATEYKRWVRFQR